MPLDTIDASPSLSEMASPSPSETFPWQNRWTLWEGSPQPVRIVTFDETSQSPEIFYFPRHLLVKSCDFFARALDDGWAESTSTQGPAIQVDEASKSLTEILIQEQERRQEMPTITLSESPRVVDDVLSYLHSPLEPSGDFENLGPVLKFADMIGLDSLKGELSYVVFLMTHTASAQALRIAEESGIPLLQRDVMTAVLHKHAEWPPLEWNTLSKPLLAKLEKRRLEFLRQRNL